MESEIFPAHRIVLAVQSSTFRNLLEGQWKESAQQEIQLGDVHPEAFRNLLGNRKDPL